ncbi:MAG: DUF3990 domain-containing protein [Bacteroides sp.]|nr:DUF3990 domain-containing protein [Bacteroides sp.]
MKVFHGSLEIVRVSEIRTPNRRLDYGSGFYLTTSREQAESWVKRKAKNRPEGGYINVYEYDERQEKGLRILDFQTPSEEWLDFVMANRLEASFHHDYDIVKGPVANDRVYASFAVYEAGLLGKNELIAELKTYKLVNQILLHTEKALSTLAFIGAKEVRS